MAGEEPGTGSADVCELLQPAQGPGVTGALPAESEEEVELANTKSVSPRSSRLSINEVLHKIWGIIRVNWYPLKPTLKIVYNAILGA